MALEQGDALPAVQAENFIRQHQIPLGIAVGLRVGPGAGVDRREQGMSGIRMLGNEIGTIPHFTEIYFAELSSISPM